MQRPRQCNQSIQSIPMRTSSTLSCLNPFCLAADLRPLLVCLRRPSIETKLKSMLLLNIGDGADGTGSSVRVVPDSPPDFTPQGCLIASYKDLDDETVARNWGKFSSIARSACTLPGLKELNIVAGPSVGFSVALARNLPEASGLTSLMVAHAVPLEWGGLSDSGAQFMPSIPKLPLLRRLKMCNTPMLPAGPALSVLRTLQELHISNTHMPAGDAAELMRQAATVSQLTSVHFDQAVTFVSVCLPSSAQPDADADTGDEDVPACSAAQSGALKRSVDPFGRSGRVVRSGGALKAGGDGPPRTRVCLSAAGLPRAIACLTQLRQLKFVHNAAAFKGAQVPLRFVPRLCACMAACRSLTSLELADVASAAYDADASLFRSACADAVAIGRLLPYLTSLRSLRIAGLRMDDEGVLPVLPLRL